MNRDAIIVSDKLYWSVPEELRDSLVRASSIGPNALWALDLERRINERARRRFLRDWFNRFRARP